jgi:hypothetical protein
MMPLRYSRRRTDKTTKSVSQNGLSRNSIKVKCEGLMLIAVSVLVKQDSAMEFSGAVALIQCHKTLNKRKRNKQLANLNHVVQL